MQCMSCKVARGTTFFEHLLLCPSCNALAEKARSEIIASIERTKTLSMQWLEQHVMAGGLLRGGNGNASLDELQELLRDAKG